MARLEQQVAELNEALLGAGTDHQRLTDLGAQLAERQSRLVEVEERWLALGEELESR